VHQFQKVQKVGTMYVQITAAASSTTMPIATVQTSRRRDRREGTAQYGYECKLTAPLIKEAVEGCCG